MFFSFQLLYDKNYLKSGFFNPKHVAVVYYLSCEFCGLRSGAVEDSIPMMCDTVSLANQFPTFLLGSLDP